MALGLLVVVVVFATAKGSILFLFLFFFFFTRFLRLTFLSLFLLIRRGCEVVFLIPVLAAVAGGAAVVVVVVVNGVVLAENEGWGTGEVAPSKSSGPRGAGLGGL